MIFKRISPSKELSNYIECFWLVKDQSSIITIQKIIPDGFPEMIFHFGDSYLIKLNGKWKRQSLSLLGGQITKHFFLKNTGTSDILGIKFRPAAIGLLFDVNMHLMTNRVISLRTLRHPLLNAIETIMTNENTHGDRIKAVERWLISIVRPNYAPPINDAVEKVLLSNGMATVGDICKETKCTERQLERMFKRYVGLSPKLYTRIIRFAYIFQNVQGSKKINGCELGNASGYYDQSHFIRNFKEFTGEDPSAYFFDQPNLANFFMQKR